MSRSVVLRISLAVSFAAVPGFAAGCHKVELAHEKPGPLGCGKRDPRQTAPGMLSVAQQKVHKEQGDPKEVRDNAHGGKDWLYYRSRGSVFGEEQTVDTFSFNAQGLLVDKGVEVVNKVGK